MGQTESFLRIHDPDSVLEQIVETVVGNGTPRKFPSPDPNTGEESDGQLVMSSIPLNPIKISGIPLQRNKQEGKRRCNFVINHEGRFKVLWDWLVLVLVIFTAIHIPYAAAFQPSECTVLDLLTNNVVKPILVLSLMVDCMFVLDILLNFRTTYMESSLNVVERNPTKLAVHYLKTWFIIDLLAAIPFDWIMISRNVGGGTSDLVGLLKSARLLRLFRVARKLDRYSEYGVAVLFLLMCLFTLIAHWFACIWYAIGKSEKHNPNSWAIRMEQLLNTSSAGSMTLSQRYVASLYFIVSSMTSVGFGNIAATTEKEQIFSVAIMLVGALMYACIFGNMVAIVQRLYSKASTFHSQINTVQEFMKFYKIPEDLRISVNNYVRREWSGSQGTDAENVLQRFPECIQADLTYQLYHKVFSSTKPLQDATESCMRALSMKFKTITLQQKNYIIKQGEELNKMYIVGKGALEILIEGDLVSYFTRHSTFGYDFNKMPGRPKSKGNVRAVNLVEVHYISKDDMLDIMEVYPKFARQFRETFVHGFDLNDTEEEGNQPDQIEEPKDKIHVAAIARQALKMPILASWTRLKRNENTKSSPKSERQQKIATTVNGLDGRRSVNPKATISLSADHLHLVNGSIPRNCQSSGARCQGVWNKLPDNNLNRSIDPIRSTTPILQISSGSQDSIHINAIQQDSLETRIHTLETEVQRMRHEIDSKLDAVIQMLQKMKTANDKEELLQQTVKNNNMQNLHCMAITPNSEPVSLTMCEKYSFGEDNDLETNEEELLRDTKI